MLKIAMQKKAISLFTAMTMLFSFFGPGIGLIETTHAALNAAGPLSAENGFPSWYQDANGLALQPCLGINPDGTGTGDVNCVLLADSTYIPSQSVSFPTNFPGEFFYYIADADTPKVGPAQVSLAFRLALEGSFSTGKPVANEQIMFLRTNLRVSQVGSTHGLVANSSYVFKHPFGTFTCVTDLNGDITDCTDASGSAIGGGSEYRREDGAFAPPVTPITAVSFLSAPLTGFGPFLKAVNPAPPAGYIGNPGIPQTIEAGPNGANLEITGPNIDPFNADGLGDTGKLTVTNWFVAGKVAVIDTTPPTINSTSPSNVQVLSTNVVASVNASDDLGIFKIKMDLGSLGNTLKATLNGSQIVSPTISAATGSGTFTINTLNNTLSYNIVSSGLEGGPEVDASIHGPADIGVNGPSLTSLSLSGTKIGTWNYPENIESDILNGRTYVKISTLLFPDGEIRGQIKPLTDVKTLIRTSGTSTGGTWGVIIPSVDRVGTFNFPISVIDGGTTLTGTFTLNVTPPPAPTISTANFTTSGSTVNIAGTGAANYALEILSGSTVVATGTVSPAGTFSVNAVPLIEGQNNFQAIIKDVAGNPSNPSAQTLTVTKDTIPPVQPIITDISGTLVNTPTITLSGTGEANSTIAVKKGTSVIAVGAADPSGVFSIAGVPITEGLNTLYVTASDAALNSSVGSANFTITLDSTPPTGTINFASGSITGLTSALVSFSTNETGSYSISGPGMTGSATGNIVSTGSAAITLNAGDGLKGVILLLKDLAGNTNLINSSITLDTTAPAAPTITSTNLTTSGSTVTISGTGEANTHVDILNGSGIVISSGSVNSSGLFNVSSVPVIVGVNSIQARLTDSVGNVGANSSQSVSVIVDTANPIAPTLQSSVAITSANTITLTGTGEASASVQIFSGSTIVGAGTIDASGSYSVSGIPLLEGSNAFRAKSFDAALNASIFSNTLNITKDSVSPVISSLRTQNVTYSLADVLFNFTDSNFTIGTGTGVVTFGTGGSLNNAGSSNLTITSGNPNTALSTLSGLIPSTTYGFNVSMFDNAGNTTTSTGSFVTSSAPIVFTGGSMFETGATTLTGSIPSGGSFPLSGINITFSSDPLDPNAITGSVSFSGITSISISGGSWNGVILPPYLLNGTAPESASTGELANLLNAMGSGVLNASTIQETVKIGGESGVSLIAVGGYFTIKIYVPTSASGKTLNIFRSSNGTNWEINTPDSTCLLDSSKTCTFKTDHLSYFAPTEVIDNIPDTLTFTTLSSRELSAVETSETKTISGINTGSTLTVTNGLVSINGGAFASSGNITNGNSIQVRLTNSATNSTTTTATLKIGTTSVGSFSSTTKAATGGGGNNGGGGVSASPTVTPVSSPSASPTGGAVTSVNTANDSATNTGTTTSTGIRFTDISDSFAKDDIIDFANKGILKGYEDKTFRPNNPITRAEFLSVVMKSLNIVTDDSLTKTTFTDVETPWMIKFVEKAKDFGIHGQIIDSKLKFRPNDPISRAEAISMLLNLAGISPSTSTTTDFTDIPMDWMIKYVVKVKELGIADGQIIDSKLKFRPNDPISRAESVKIIKKTLNIKNASAETIKAPETTASGSTAISQTGSINGSGSTTSTQTGSKTFEIVINSDGVMPTSIEINKGDTVKFINKDSLLHWPASAVHPSHSAYPGSGIEKCGTSAQAGIFDACKGLAKDEIFTFKFDEIGEWKFHDHLNPTVVNLRGTVIVK